MSSTSSTGAAGSGLRTDRQRTVDVARLLGAVGHGLLLRPIVGLLQYRVERQVQGRGQPPGEVRHQIGVSKRRNAGHPGRRGLRVPLSHQAHTGFHQFIRKAPVPVLALTHQAAPPGIPPDAKRLAGLCLKRRRQFVR